MNVSTRNLLDLELPNDIRRLLRVAKLDPAKLTLEITESSIMANQARAMHVLAALHAIGVRLSIDDFGTGYSSLSHLKQLPVDELKVDKSFVKDMADDEYDFVIVRATIDLGQKLGLQIVAEGVETEEIQWQLSEIGCDVAQGFHFSRPLPAEDVSAWIERRATRDLISGPDPSVVESSDAATPI